MFLVLFEQILEVHLGTSQISKMELFAEIVPLGHLPATLPANSPPPSFQKQPAEVFLQILQNS